jgi:hypothetical protein
MPYPCDQMRTFVVRYQLINIGGNGPRRCVRRPDGGMDFSNKSIHIYGVFLMLLNDIQSTVALGRELNIFPGSFKGTVQGTGRSIAVGAALKIKIAQEGEVPTDPTLEVRNEQDDRGIDEGSPRWHTASVGPDKEQSPEIDLAQAAMVLRYLELEFGQWEHDDGVRGTVKHLIRSNESALDLDEIEEIFGTDDPQVVLNAIEMAAKKADLERFEHDIVAMVEKAVADADPDEAEPEWLADAICKGAKNQKSKLGVMMVRGTVTKANGIKMRSWLDGLIVLQQ